MRRDREFLSELELWPLVEMQRRTRTAADESAPAPTAAPTPRRPTMENTTSAPAPTRTAPRRTTTPPPAPLVPIHTPIQADPARTDRVAGLDWPALRAEVISCQACGLCKQRKQAVFGVGQTAGPWLFVGEGPGADEDEQGDPFVGQAGKLLDAMLQAAGLQRGREVYIANVVKCRPPGNRTPTPDEAAACAPFLDRQIALIAPKLIVALGKTAVTRLTGSEAAMSSLRGRLFHYRGIPVVPTYHPAYLLRSLPEKLKAWEDLLFAKREMAKRL